MNRQEEPTLDVPDDSQGPIAAAGADVPALLRSAAAGDEAAWRALVELYARRVYALAKSRLGGGTARPPGSDGGKSGGAVGARARGGCELAEEITQSVFVTVATKLVGGGYIEQGRFESWLFRVAMNRIRDEVRRARRHAAAMDPEAFDALPAAKTEATERPELLDTLRAAMARLADADREVVELRHHAGMSFKQIADLLEEPLGTLLARHHRALRKLKDLMTSGGAPTALAGQNGGE